MITVLVKEETRVRINLETKKDFPIGKAEHLELERVLMSLEWLGVRLANARIFNRLDCLTNSTISRDYIININLIDLWRAVSLGFLRFYLGGLWGFD